jgi:hypothetical protein
MGFFLLLKYIFIIFAAHLAASCGAPFENHCSIAAVFNFFCSLTPYIISLQLCTLKVVGV